MSHMLLNGMSDGYIEILDFIRICGMPSSPRGLPTREVLGASITVINPADNLPVATGRNLNSKIAYAEALQLVAGRSFPELMVRIAPNFKEFTNGGTWFHGAYGPRLRNQMHKVMDAIRNDPNTRQAVATIWDPSYDGHGDVKDTPCTVALQYFRRGDRLHAVTFMRSNDAWWGVPYDIFQFTFLQQHLASSLGLDVGEYNHFVGSLHMYDRDLEAAEDVGVGKVQKFPGQLIVLRHDTPWSVIADVAEAILANTHHVQMSTYGRWLREQLHG